MFVAFDTALNQEHVHHMREEKRLVDSTHCVQGKYLLSYCEIVSEKRAKMIVETGKLASVRPKVLHAYQEQGDTLDVKFICHDGTQLCSKAVLEVCSDFFSRQMLARERFGNCIEFNYAENVSQFSKKCIKNMLDAMHGLNIEVGGLADLMELIKFIQYEDKCDSDYEQTLIKLLCEAVENACFFTATKLLVCTIADTFDNFSGKMEERLLNGTGVQEIQDASFEIDLSTDENVKLVALVNAQNIRDDIESAAYRLAKRRKTEKETRPIPTTVQEVLKNEEEEQPVDQLAQNKVKIVVHAVTKRASPFSIHSFHGTLEMRVDNFEIDADSTFDNLKWQLLSDPGFKRTFKGFRLTEFVFQNQTPHDHSKIFWSTEGLEEKDIEDKTIYVWYD